MKVWNPTGYKIEGRADGKYYQFEPYEEKDVWIDTHASHLCKALKYRGLVHLVYAEVNKAKYSTYEAFKKAQQLSGLKELVKTEREAWINERQAQRDVKEHAGAEADKDIIDPDKFAERLRIAEQWLADAAAPSPKKEEVVQAPVAESKVAVVQRTKRGRRTVGALDDSNPNVGGDSL